MNAKTYTKLHTTARTSMRMSAEDKEKLHQRLKPYAWDGSLPEGEAKCETELEIGMGNGLAMLARAQNAPNRFFIGSEVYLNGVKSLLHALETSGNSPKNLRISTQDGRDVLASFPNNSLHRILVTFPDPWPKTRHHKRRIVQPDFLNTVYEKLNKETGEFWVMTDIADYALFSLQHLYVHPSLKIIAANPHSFAQAPNWWTPSKYQKKAATEGRNPWFMCAQPAEAISHTTAGRYSHSGKEEAKN